MKNLALIVALLVPNVVTAAEYHVIFFSYQNKGLVASPLQSHTFATFTESNRGRIARKVEINWAPVNQWRITQGKVPGHNHDVNGTIRKAVSDAKDPKEVQAWGPYSTDRALFEKALQTHQILEDHYLYKAVDLRVKNSVDIPAVNCITAVKMVLGALFTGSRMGHEATKEIVQFYEDEGVIHPSRETTKTRQKSEVIYRQLGLNKYPIKRN